MMLLILHRKHLRKAGYNDVLCESRWEDVPAGFLLIFIPTDFYISLRQILRGATPECLSRFLLPFVQAEA